MPNNKRPQPAQEEQSVSAQLAQAIGAQPTAPDAQSAGVEVGPARAPRPTHAQILKARWVAAVLVIDELRAKRGRIGGKMKTGVWHYEEL